MPFWAILLVVLFFAPCFAQGQDRFGSERECVAAVEEGTAVWYRPSFFDHRNRPPVRPVAVTRPLEERACVEMWVVGGWAWVPQPGIPQGRDEGVETPRFDFDAMGKPIRRKDCGNAVRSIVYVPRPSPPAVESEPEPAPRPMVRRVPRVVVIPRPAPPLPPEVVVCCPAPPPPPPALKPAPVVRKGGHGKVVAVIAGVAVAGAVAYFATRDRSPSRPSAGPPGTKPGVAVISPASAGGAPRAVGFALRF
jgi:hypothetical protein